MALAVLAAAPAPASGQEAGVKSVELPEILPREREVALARSAAPDHVSSGATVWVLERGTGYVVAEEGTGDVACFVDRSWPEAVEPHCFDAEGARTVLRHRLRFAELREKGLDADEIQRTLDRELADGTLPLPTRPAVTYMMSAAQELYDRDRRPVGAWRPHLMIYVPWITAEDVGNGAVETLEGVVVVDPGKPLANLMIVVPDAVEPRAGASDAAEPPGERRSPPGARGGSTVSGGAGSVSSEPAP